MEVLLNGEPARVDEALSVAELLRLHRLAPERVAIEINEQLVRRALFGETILKPGDRIEIVTLVGGG